MLSFQNYNIDSRDTDETDDSAVHDSFNNSFFPFA